MLKCWYAKMCMYMPFLVMVFTCPYFVISFCTLILLYMYICTCECFSTQSEKKSTILKKYDEEIEGVTKPMFELG